MAYTLLANGFAADIDHPTTSALDCTGADLIVIAVQGNNGAYTVHDSQNNTYTLIDSHTDSSNVKSVFYCQSPSTSNAQTFNIVESFIFAAIFVQVFSGSSASPLDAHTQGSGFFSATCQPGSITPSENNELLICFGTVYSSTGANFVSIGGGFSTTNQNPNTGSALTGGLAYLIQTTATASNPTLTIDDANGFPIAFQVAFKAASAPTSSVGPYYYTTFVSGDGSTF
jgi:hypothetical protein